MDTSDKGRGLCWARRDPGREFVEDLKGETGLLICDVAWRGGCFGATKPGATMLDCLLLLCGSPDVTGLDGVSATLLLRGSDFLGDLYDVVDAVLVGGGMFVVVTVDGIADVRGAGSLDILVGIPVPAPLTGLTGILESSMALVWPYSGAACSRWSFGV